LIENGQEHLTGVNADQMLKEAAVQAKILAEDVTMLIALIKSKSNK